MKNLLGVVLCGGESKRMGSDKGLMQKNGTSWAGLVANKITSLNIPVVFSINHQQSETYSALFSRDRLILDNIEIQGPLKGLLSVHQKYPQFDILLMACDLIDMDETTLRYLISEFEFKNEFDFFVYQGDFAEPFCAIYTSRGLRPVLEKAQDHALLKFSFQTILDEGRTLRIPLTDTSSFRNYNTIPGHHKE